MQEVINQQGLTWKKPFSNQKNETIYFMNDQAFKELKNSAARKAKEAQATVNREGKREKITRFNSIICEFSIFLCCLL